MTAEYLTGLALGALFVLAWFIYAKTYPEQAQAEAEVEVMQKERQAQAEELKRKCATDIESDWGQVPEGVQGQQEPRRKWWKPIFARIFLGGAALTLFILSLWREL